MNAMPPLFAIISVAMYMLFFAIVVVGRVREARLIRRLNKELDRPRLTPNSPVVGRAVKPIRV